MWWCIPKLVFLFYFSIIMIATQNPWNIFRWSYPQFKRTIVFIFGFWIAVILNFSGTHLFSLQIWFNPFLTYMLVALSGRKSMTLIFWDAKNVLFVVYLLLGEPIHAEKNLQSKENGTDFWVRQFCFCTAKFSCMQLSLFQISWKLNC